MPDDGLNRWFNSNKTVMITDIGGIAVKYTAGENLTAGDVVRVTGVNTVSKIVVNVPDPIGVVYATGLSGAEVLVVITGVANVYFIGNTTAGQFARGFLTADGGSYVTGQAICEAVPTAPFASDKHFYEIGHVLETRVGAGLAKVNIHFN